jgi:uncharacterized protein YodC (DUF2158 family)
MTLHVGEVVRLKSGGPAMTVVATSPRAEPSVVDCAWFDRNQGFATASFPSRAVERVGLPQPAARPSDVAPRTGLAAS